MEEQGPATVEVVGLVENAKYLNVRKRRSRRCTFRFEDRAP